MPPQLTESDYQILVSAIKHNKPKFEPDFKLVAEECGMKNARSAYLRHWHVMRKLGLTGSNRSTKKKGKEEEHEADGDEAGGDEAGEGEGEAGGEADRDHNSGKA